MIDELEYRILRIIREFKKGEPVGYHSVDNLLLADNSDFIFSGKLGERLRHLEKKGLIIQVTGKGGYILTEKGETEVLEYNKNNELLF